MNWKLGEYGFRQHWFPAVLGPSSEARHESARHDCFTRQKERKFRSPTAKSWDAQTSPAPSVIFSEAQKEAEKERERREADMVVGSIV